MNEVKTVQCCETEYTRKQRLASEMAKNKQMYDKGFDAGLKQGISRAFAMKEDADGCCSCAFENVEPWEMPCAKCARNSKDYWRAKEEYYGKRGRINERT